MLKHSVRNALIKTLGATATDIFGNARLNGALGHPLFPSLSFALMMVMFESRIHDNRVSAISFAMFTKYPREKSRFRDEYLSSVATPAKADCMLSLPN